MKLIELNKKIEKKIDEICNLLTEGRDKHNLSISTIAEEAIIKLAIYGGQNHYESLGILEEAKIEYVERFKQMVAKEQFEEEHFPVDIETFSFPQNLQFKVCASQLDEPSNLDIRTKLFHNYLIENDIDPIIGDVEDWFVTHVDNNINGGEIWTLSN